MLRWVLVCIVAVSGCGGGGGGAPRDPSGSAQDLDDRLETLEVSNPALLPTQGRAEYNGYMRARLPTGEDGALLQYLGDLNLDVNFAAARDQIAGSATGFATGGSERLDGTLRIAQGDIYPTTDPQVAYSFDGDVTGNLTDARGTYIIDGSIEGEFLGRDQRAVSGLVFGDVTGPDGLALFDGTFAAEKRAE